MSFDPNDPRITAYVLGELNADERKAFESALSASGDLQQAVQATRQATERLACELRTEPSASLSDPQRESVLRAARQRDAHPLAASAATGRRRKWVLGGVAIAASLLGLCWGGSLLYRVAGERQQVVARGRRTMLASRPRVGAPRRLPRQRQARPAPRRLLKVLRGFHSPTCRHGTNRPFRPKRPSSVSERTHLPMPIGPCRRPRMAERLRRVAPRRRREGPE